MNVRPATLKAKLRKPPTACSNAYCRRPPRPGGKTCRRCREYANAWKRANRPSRAKGVAT